MADVIYKVAVELATKGNLDTNLDRPMSKAASLHDALDRVKASAASIGTSVASAFTGAVEKVADVVAGIGKLAAVGAGAGIAYGVVHLNNELEKTQISLAAIFNANGVAGDMTRGMGMAADMMGKIRADAAALPGETRDLMQFFTLGLNPGLKLGGSTDQLEKMSANAMAAAASVNLPMEQAAREYAMLLQGRAGAHNIFGLQLGFAGDEAEKFNKLSGTDRLKAVSEALGRFEPAIKQFSTSFEGASSTFRDNVKKFVADATHPLFERVRDTLLKANGWLESNQATAIAMADRIGHALVTAYDKGTAAIERWWPALQSFAMNAEQRLAEIWQKIEPFAERFGGKALGFLGDPQSIGKIEDVLKLYAAVKIGGPLLGPAMNMGGGLLEMMGGAGLGGAAGGLGELAAASGPLAIALLAVGGAIHAITDESSIMHDVAVSQWKDITSSISNSLNDLGSAAGAVTPMISTLADLLGSALLAATESASHALEGLSAAIGAAAAAASNAIQSLTNTGTRLNGGEGGGIGGGAANLLMLSADSIVNDAIKNPKITFDTDEVVLYDKGGKKPAKWGGGGGGGGVHIDKVEVTVSQSNDPNRVARVIGGHLSDMSRFRKQSPFVPNFSASR